MAVTPLLFFGLFVGGILAAIVVGAHFGLYTYLLMFHVSPHDAWWGDMVPDLRYLLIAGIVAMLTVMVRKDPYPRDRWTGHRSLVVFAVFTIWVWIQNLWVISPIHMEGSVLFTKHLLITLVVYRLAKENLELAKNVCLVIVIGAGWFGWQTMGKSGRVEGAAGAIADANTLGMHTAACVMVASMMLLGLKDRYRWIPFACTPFILNTVIQAGSRGAFIGLLCGGFVAMYFCPPSLKGRFRLLGALGVMLFFMLAHQQFIDRMVELVRDLGSEEEELDGSAASRMDIARAGWRMALDYPMGVGHRGTAILSPLYMEEHLLSRGRHGMESGRAAHNSFMAALVSYGFIGLAIYVSIFAWCGASLLKLRRFAARTEDVELGCVTGALASGLAVVLVAGQFSNYVYAEVQFWMLGLIAGLTAQARRIAESSTAAAEQVPNHRFPNAPPPIISSPR